MKHTRIAVLLTCYNRRDSTLKCLEAVYCGQLLEGVSLDVYLVDDGCADGTGEDVRKYFPHVNIIQGNGKLFWNGGMRLAWSEAMKGHYDFYLWLNEDTYLFPHAVKLLLDTWHLIKSQDGWEGIIVGSVKDPESGEHTYGGIINRSRWRLKFVRVLPSDKTEKCDTMNGNIVLIHREIAKAVGNLSPDYTHGIGDYDYGLRAKAQGFRCWIAPGYLGTCSRNEEERFLRDPRLPIKERLQSMASPTGLPPAREWIRFTRRHAGPLWPLYWIRTLVRTCFPRLWMYLRSSKRTTK